MWRYLSANLDCEFFGENVTSKYNKQIFVEQCHIMPQWEIYGTLLNV